MGDTASLGLCKKGMQARRTRGRLPRDPDPRPSSAVVENLFDRQFRANAPKQRSAADFNCGCTREGWLYFAVDLDLVSRAVVGWSMRPTRAAQLVADALLMAIARRARAEALLHQSDHGSQYSSELFRRLRAEQGIACSMSRQCKV